MVYSGYMICFHSGKKPSRLDASYNELQIFIFGLKDGCMVEGNVNVFSSECQSQECSLRKAMLTTEWLLYCMNVILCSQYCL